MAVREWLPACTLAAAYLGLVWAAYPGRGTPIPAGEGLGLASPAHEIACSPWKPVSSGGFDLPSETGGAGGDAPYQGEEGFEVLVFRGQLYVGMEADNALGARLWRSRAGISHPDSQSSWEEVIADSKGLPWGIEDLAQVDHIDSLAAFQGRLYASSANSGEPDGTRVFRSPSGDPGSWEDALRETGPGFGKPQNENFKDMQVFDGQLCGGTWNETDGAEVWCTPDGLSWQQKNRSGFGDSENRVIWSGAVFRGALYFGVDNPAGGAVYRNRSLAGRLEWERVYQGEAGRGAPLLVGDSDGRLFIATHSINGIQVLASKTGDEGSWETAGRPGITGSRWNTGSVTDGAVVYQGALHLAVQNPLLGFRVWRLEETGLWALVGEVRDYDPNAFAAQLAVFNDRLYAWTSNYRSGQAVWETTCSPGPVSPEPTGLPGLLVMAALVVVLATGARKGGQWRTATT